MPMSCYIELTEHFVGLQNKSEYFFKYDGHPNKKGYEEIVALNTAEELEPQLPIAS